MGIMNSLLLENNEANVVTIAKYTEPKLYVATLHFCACSESKKRFYKILILSIKSKALSRLCKLYHFKMIGTSYTNDVQLKVPSFQKSHFCCDIKYSSDTLSIYIFLIRLKL